MKEEKNGEEIRLDLLFKFRLNGITQQQQALERNAG